MDEVMVGSVEQLYEESKGKDIYMELSQLH